MVLVQSDKNSQRNNHRQNSNFPVHKIRLRSDLPFHYSIRNDHARRV